MVLKRPCNSGQFGKHYRGISPHIDNSRQSMMMTKESGNRQMANVSTTMLVFQGLRIPRATVPAELTYASTGPLMGARRMDFGPDDYPDAWQWSLTPYNQTGNIVPNPYNIYSVNNRSPNLNVSADGGLAVVFQETPPTFEKGIHWVPIPGNRTLYNILFRITLGGKDVLDRTYQVPGIFAIE